MKIAIAIVAVGLLGLWCRGEESASSVLGKIMPLGDSITKGAPAGAFRAPLYQMLKEGGHEFRFVGSLTENPTPELTAAGQDHHEGHSGMGMSWIDDHLKEFLAANRPDRILLAIGANDVGNATLAELKDRMNRLVSDIGTLAPGVKLYVAGITPQTGPAMVKIREFNAVLPELVAAQQAKGVAVVYVAMDALDTTDLEDNVHPNVAGSRKMAWAWHDALVGSAPTSGRDPSTPGGGN